MDLITKDSETTLVLFSSLDRVLENVEYVVMNYRPVLNGEHYLTGEEVDSFLNLGSAVTFQII